MNKNSFLDYYKTILEKVSFDRQLLIKEYKKAKQLLGASDAKELDSWIKRKGLNLHIETLSETQKDAWQISPTPRVDRL